MHDSRVSYMDTWLKNKKLNEAYKVTQLRSDSQLEQEIEQDKHQLQRGNAKTYKQWMQQTHMQQRYEEIERAHHAQMEADAQMQDEAKMGIQAQINQLSNYSMEEEEEMEGQGYAEYNALRNKQY